MTRDEMVTAIKGITNVNKQIGTVYSVLTELGIKFTKTACSRCRRDLLNIAKEELGLIESAADNSEFNGTAANGWKYTKPNGTVWNGHIYNWYSSEQDIERINRAFPGEFFIKITDNTKEQDNG